MAESLSKDSVSSNRFKRKRKFIENFCFSQVMTAPFSRTGTGTGTTGYSSDGDTDEE